MHAAGAVPIVIVRAGWSRLLVRTGMMTSWMMSPGRTNHPHMRPAAGTRTGLAAIFISQKVRFCSYHCGLLVAMETV